jgi:aspartokinase
MVKKVLKFGGTSVGTIERIQHVANIIKKNILLEINYCCCFCNGGKN